MNAAQKLTVLSLLIYVTASSCGFTGSVATPKATAVQLETSQPIASTLTNTPISTLTQAMTLAPTLLPAEAEAKSLELLRNNGECLLPCFWGYTPVHSNGEFLSFLMQIGSNDGNIVLTRDDLFVKTQVTFLEDSRAVYTVVYRESASGIEKVYDTSYYKEYFQYYSLQNLLSVYGLPEQVYVALDTGIEDMGLGIDLYLLSIEYPSVGWMAVFEMPLQQKEDIFIGCPSEAFTNLRLWSPDNIPAGAFIGGFGGDDKSYLFTIEDATGLTVEDFYQRFKDPKNVTCLETPTDIHK